MAAVVLTNVSGHMEQAMEKIIDVFQRGKHSAGPDDFQLKDSACQYENNGLLSLLPYSVRK